MMLARLARGVAVVVLCALVASACRIDTGDITTNVTAAAAATGTSPGSAVQDIETGLSVLGPIPAASHWHAAYVVRICDDVLAPFDSEADPLGIHSHGDGLMHVHPFFESAGYESATLGLFADAMGMQLSEGELTLPGGGTWRDGDLCNGVPGRVFVDRWRDPNPASAVERIFTAPEAIRYLADGELYQIAFAPIDSLPVVPPTTANLSEYSNLAPPPEPWVDVDSQATIDEVKFWSVQSVEAEPCAGAFVPERVLFGAVRCFERRGAQVVGSDAVTTARAVVLNRAPAIEVRMTIELQSLIADHFATTENPMALAVEVDGFVLTAPIIQRPPLSDRLVISGGLSAESATTLARILNG